MTRFCLTSPVVLEFFDLLQLCLHFVCHVNVYIKENLRLHSCTDDPLVWLEKYEALTLRKIQVYSQYRLKTPIFTCNLKKYAKRLTSNLSKRK